MGSTKVIAVTNPKRSSRAGRRAGFPDALAARSIAREQGAMAARRSSQADEHRQRHGLAAASVRRARPAARRRARGCIISPGKRR